MGCIKMEMMQGKHFSITDPKGVNTVIYQVNKTEKEFMNEYPKYTVERLDHTEELVGNFNKKTFYVNEPQKDGNQLVILSFAQDKVVINSGLLLGNEVKITKRPTPFKFNTLYSEEEMEYKDFDYTPNLKRSISIIDPETTEEVKPVLYFDEKTNEVKGKCKLKPYKSYFAFEIRRRKIRRELIMANANAKSKPAGINDKVDIDVMSMVQIVEKENKKDAPVKTVVTNSAKVIGILSTDLDLGVTIKAYDGVKEKEDTVAR